MKAVTHTSTNTALKATISINIKAKMKVNQAESRIEDSDTMSPL
jgi:hypothetical protein